LAFHSGREADHSPPSSAEVKEWVEMYLHSPNTPSWHGAQLGEHILIKLQLGSYCIVVRNWSWRFIVIGIFLYSITRHFSNWPFISTEQNPSWEANSCSFSKEIIRFLWNPKVHWCFHSSPQLDSILSQTNRIHITSYFSIFLPSTSRSPNWSHLFRFSD
jgi:hypothetical protein